MHVSHICRDILDVVIATKVFILALWQVVAKSQELQRNFSDMHGEAKKLNGNVRGLESRDHINVYVCWFCTAVHIHSQSNNKFKLNVCLEGAGR